MCVYMCESDYMVMCVSGSIAGIPITSSFLISFVKSQMCA